MTSFLSSLSISFCLLLVLLRLSHIFSVSPINLKPLVSNIYPYNSSIHLILFKLLSTKLISDGSDLMQICPIYDK